MMYPRGKVEIRSYDLLGIYRSYLTSNSAATSGLPKIDSYGRAIDAQAVSQKNNKNKKVIMPRIRKYC